MDNRTTGILLSIVISSVVLFLVIGSADLSSLQSEALRYNINTECQVYAEFVNWGITEESINDPKINPKVMPLILDLIVLEGDPRDYLEKIQEDNPQCKNELGKLKPKPDN